MKDSPLSPTEEFCDLPDRNPEREVHVDQPARSPAVGSVQHARHARPVIILSKMNHVERFRMHIPTPIHEFLIEIVCVVTVYRYFRLKPRPIAVTSLVPLSASSAIFQIPVPEDLGSGGKSE